METPEHYRPEDGRPEAIEVIEAVLRSAGLDYDQTFALGNVLKYALRAGRKGDWREDCEKAGSYARRMVEGEW